MNIPRLGRLMIKTAFIWLVLGFTFGALMLSIKGRPWWPGVWRFKPVHIDMLLFGWLVQFIMGVGYWIFPRYRGQRGRPAAAWGAFVTLNLGLLLELYIPLSKTSHLAQWLTPLSLVLFGLAALSFIVHAWPRIRPFLIPSK